MVENVSLFKTQRFGSLKPGLNLDLFQQIVIEEEVKKCYSEVGGVVILKNENLASQ